MRIKHVLNLFVLLALQQLVVSCSTFSANIYTAGAIEQKDAASIISIYFNEALIDFDEDFIKYDFMGKISDGQLGNPGKAPTQANLLSGEASPALYYVTPGIHKLTVKLFGDVQEERIDHDYVRRFQPTRSFSIENNFQPGKIYRLSYNRSFFDGLPTKIPVFIETAKE